MKRILEIMMVIVIIVFMLIGCATNNEVVNNNQQINAKPGVSKTKEKILAKYNNQDATSDVEEELEALWSANATINFEIHGQEYAIGDTCASILNDFTVVEISDGHVKEDGTIASCEKVTIKLADEQNNQFVAVIRNNMNQPIKMEDCTLHEILVERDSFDLGSIDIDDIVNGDTNVDSWTNAFGNSYSDYSDNDKIFYSWEIDQKCYADVCFDNENKNVIRIQLMTY